MAIYRAESTGKPGQYIFLRGKTAKKDVREELEVVTPMLFGEFVPGGQKPVRDILELDLSPDEDLFFYRAIIFELSGKKYVPGGLEVGKSKIVSYTKGSHLVAEIDPDNDLLAKAYHTLEILYEMPVYSVKANADDSEDIFERVVEAFHDEGIFMESVMSDEEAEQLDELRMRDNFDIIEIADTFVREFHFLNSKSYDKIEDHMRNPVYHDGVRYPLSIEHELFSNIGLDRIASIMQSQPTDFFGTVKGADESGLIAIVRDDKILEQFK